MIAWARRRELPDGVAQCLFVLATILFTDIVGSIEKAAAFAQIQGSKSSPPHRGRMGYADQQTFCPIRRVTIWPQGSFWLATSSLYPCDFSSAGWLFRYPLRQIRSTLVARDENQAIDPYRSRTRRPAPTATGQIASRHRCSARARLSLSPADILRYRMTPLAIGHLWLDAWARCPLRANPNTNHFC